MDVLRDTVGIGPSGVRELTASAAVNDPAGHTPFTVVVSWISESGSNSGISIASLLPTGTPKGP